MSDSNLNLVAYALILLWMLLWTVRSIKGWTGRLQSIKSLLFLGCAWVGIIAAGLNYFMK